MAPLTKTAVASLLGSVPRGLTQVAAKAVGEIIRGMMPALSPAGANEVAQIIFSITDTPIGVSSMLDAIRSAAETLGVPVQRHHLEPLRTAVESGITVDDFFKLVHRHYPRLKRRAPARARKPKLQTYEPIRASVRVPELPEMSSSTRAEFNSLLGRLRSQSLPTGEVAESVGGSAMRGFPWSR